MGVRNTTNEAEEAQVPSDLESDCDDSLLRRVAGCYSEPAGADGVPELGTVIDDTYVLERLLGRGGMGCVFAARHVTTGLVVAIKWMVGREDQKHLRKRFLREARATGRIRHPNVIDIYDAVSSPQGTYLVMELLAGESLRARLNSGRLAPAQAVEVALSVLEGLYVAHERGVIHRDLKPENVFLCSKPAYGVKILDFGISVLRDTQPLPESNLTRTGYFVGTPVYTALERLREKQPFDHRVDLYSVGVVLYEMLTGALPFSGRTPSELTYQLALSAPHPLRELRPELPESLEAIVLKALAREPSQRFDDAHAFFEALRSVMDALEEQDPEKTSDDEPATRSSRTEQLARDDSLAEGAPSEDEAPAGHVKGTLLVHLQNYAIQHHGQRAWQDVLDQLSPGDRSELCSLLIVGGWYPVGIWNRTLSAYLRMNFTNPGLGMTDFGHYVAAQDLTTLFKLVLRMGSADMVVARTASLYNRYFDSGTWTPVKLRTGHWRCTLEVSRGQNSGPGELSCSEGITAWVRRALELTGTKAVVDKRRCRFRGDSRCEYDVTWQESVSTLSEIARTGERLLARTFSRDNKS